MIPCGRNRWGVGGHVSRHGQNRGSNGVRQGSPDSPVLFAAIIATTGGGPHSISKTPPRHHRVYGRHLPLVPRQGAPPADHQRTACTSTPPRRPSYTVSPWEGGSSTLGWGGGAVSVVRHGHYGLGVPIDLPGARCGHHRRNERASQECLREAPQTPVCTHPQREAAYAYHHGQDGTSALCVAPGCCCASRGSLGGAGGGPGTASGSTPTQTQTAGCSRRPAMDAQS